MSISASPIAATPDKTKDRLVDGAEPTWAVFLKPFAGSMARQALAAGAGLLVAHGYATSSGAEQLIAGGMAAAAAGWSWYFHSGRAKIQQALSDAVDLLHVKALDARARAPAGASIGGTRVGPSGAA